MVVRRWLVLLAGALALLVVGVWAYAAYDVQRYASVPTQAVPPARDVDVAIVLGAAVAEGAPTPVFVERIRHGIDLYDGGHVRALIFTGGVGFADELSEAEVARRYAVERGVPEAAIYCEEASRVTYENLRGARDLMADLGLQTAAIVSDPLHMRRAMAMAQDLGIEAVSSPTPTTRYRSWSTRTAFLLRESRLYAAYLLRRPFIGPG